MMRWIDNTNYIMGFDKAMDKSDFSVSIIDSDKLTMEFMSSIEKDDEYICTFQLSGITAKLEEQVIVNNYLLPDELFEI